jgi:hypothetical protein
MMNTRRILLLTILIVPFFAPAQDGAGVAENTPVEVSGAIEWEKMELSATVSLNLAAARIRLPTGRIQAEEIIRQEYATLMRPYILALPVDSSTVLGDLIDRGELGFFGPETAAASARRSPAALSPDLSRLSATYTIDLSLLTAQLTSRRRPGELRRVLSPVPAAAYTGVIIIASEELPLHGRNTAAYAEPCLFPRIWDTEMNLIYERNNIDNTDTPRTLVRYASEDGIFRTNPSGLSPEVEALAGKNPLRIIARGLFGIRPTDPVIDKDDALIILSTENNRRLLREGKVVIILSNGVLRKNL